MANDKKPTLWEQLAKGVADAVSDVRDTVVFDAWFGSAPERDCVAPQWPKAREAGEWEPNRENDRDRERGMDI